MVNVLQTSRNCCRCALASSFGFPQKGLLYTIVIRPILISKFASPVLTHGTVRMLVVEGAKNSRRVGVAIGSELDDAELIGSTTESVI